MMTIPILAGVWTYRSFANTPDPVGSFDKLKIWEAELYLEIGEGGRAIYGHIGERPEQVPRRHPYLTVLGTLTEGDQRTVQLRATGVPDTKFEGWIYDYQGILVAMWADGKRGQRPTIVGTVTRTVAHDGAPAGDVFSFIAVKQSFLEPRRSHPLAEPAVKMLASAEHRFHHALWHASRDEWATTLSQAKQQALRDLNWQPGPKGKERASLGKDRLTNGCGEDFLFMHRRMIADARALDPKAVGWRRLPRPIPLASFAEKTEAKTVGNPDGDAVPDPWVVPGDPGATAWLHSLRLTSTLYSPFQAWEAQFADPNFLSRMTLGELGWRIEFTIHNWAHMRWASIPRDPKSGDPVPGGRASLDFDEKWLDPAYDYLGEFFSSHVNPIFWRLHGWVDDRIEDWFRAQEMVRPGVIKREKVLDVEWFEIDGKWVIAPEPWEGPRANHGNGHGGVVLDVAAMKAALTIIFGPEPTTGPVVLTARTAAMLRPRATWFKNVLDQP